MWKGAGGNSHFSDKKLHNSTDVLLVLTILKWEIFTFEFCVNGKLFSDKTKIVEQAKISGGGNCSCFPSRVPRNGVTASVNILF